MEQLLLEFALRSGNDTLSDVVAAGMSKFTFPSESRTGFSEKSMQCSRPSGPGCRLKSNCLSTCRAHRVAQLVLQIG